MAVVRVRAIPDESARKTEVSSRDGCLAVMFQEARRWDDRLEWGDQNARAGGRAATRACMVRRRWRELWDAGLCPLVLPGSSSQSSYPGTWPSRDAGGRHSGTRTAQARRAPARRQASLDEGAE